MSLVTLNPLQRYIGRNSQGVRPTRIGSYFFLTVFLVAPSWKLVQSSNWWDINPLLFAILETYLLCQEGQNEIDHIRQSTNYGGRATSIVILSQLSTMEWYIDIS